MCAQFMIRAKIKELEKLYGAALAKDFGRGFEFKPHVFPSYLAPVITLENGHRTLRPMHFGLWRNVPMKNKSGEWEHKFKRLHNARSETVAEKKMFSKILKSHRCLVPLNSFFEFVPAHTPNKKARIQLAAEDDHILTAAGLFDETENDKGQMEFSFTILTRAPHAFIKSQGHDRSPAFLAPEAFDKWLNPTTPVSVIKTIDPCGFHVVKDPE